MPESSDPDPPAGQEVVETSSMANCATLVLHGSAIEKADTSGSPESASQLASVTRWQTNG